MKLCEFEKGDRVFVAHSPGDWFGVEVYRRFPSKGTVEATVVFTNGIPGLEIGELLTLDGEVPAYPKVTVNALIRLAQEKER